ncbi:hypothetical protein I3843_09G176300 [Carya illinoinensis]|nr:hypothetical protein I3843_09G176300 [Carya illinoinensis]
MDFSHFWVSSTDQPQQDFSLHFFFISVCFPTTLTSSLLDNLKARLAMDSGLRGAEYEYDEVGHTNYEYEVEPANNECDEPSRSHLVDQDDDVHVQL